MEIQIKNTMKNKVAIIIQARMNSTRLPKKVLAKLNEKSLFEFLVTRLKKSALVNEIILATTNNSMDDPLYEKGKELNLKIVRGNEDDVLDRFFEASKLTKANLFIRVTADCPFIDQYLIKDLINEFLNQKVDYLSNCYPPTLPDGLDLEIFTRESLISAHHNCRDLKKREHVTTWIRESGNFKVGSIKYPKDYSNLRLTVDEPEDLALVRKIIRDFNIGDDSKWHDLITILNENPELVKINSKFERNEGALMDQNKKMWNRAKKIIPGGNMLLSKRPEMFLPEKWPAYFLKTKGVNLWDLNKIKYTDMALMGVGTNSLGYSHPQIDKAVMKTLRQGNLSSLNCIEEVLLAEKLIEMHPWAEMVKFARTGGEANAISIRIARAAAGRDTIAICGYHGWHDWYLATNLNNKNGLEEHLLSGLEPNGVPKSLKDSVKPFSFNNLEQLKNIVKNNKLAAIKMEVERSTPPKIGFLEAVREICDKEKIILIFDECTSGFRETFGGIHKKYGVSPDIAIFGKALGNGYAITSIIGRSSVMESSQSTFISSTFWTERIGPSAALKTLEIMEKERSWEQITLKGEKLRNIWSDLATKHDLEIEINGIKALSGFNFKSKNNREYKNLITQEMLKKGFLASTTCYLSTAHNSKVFERYANCLDDVFNLISRCEKGYNIQEMLNHPLSHNGFERLN